VWCCLPAAKPYKPLKQSSAYLICSSVQSALEATQSKSTHELSLRGLAFLIRFVWMAGWRLSATGLFLPAGAAGGVARNSSARGAAVHDPASKGEAHPHAGGAPGAGPGSGPHHQPIRRPSGGGNAPARALSMAEEVQAFLLTYVLTRRNPLSTTASTLRCALP
jgi:hypothetical protein